MKKVGISQIGISIPKNFISLSELAKKRKISPNFPEKGLNLKESRILFEESLLDLVKKALLKINFKDVKRFYFATESDPDASKPIAVKILSKLNLSFVPFQLKFACLGGIEALISACEYCALKEQPAAVLIFDKSWYSEKNSKAEITQGAAAVCLRIERNPKLLEINYKKFGEQAIDIDDFKVPFYNFPFPEIKRNLTKAVYLECQKRAFENWKQKRREGKILEKFDFFVFHVPFPKIVEWLAALIWKIEEERKNLSFSKCFHNPSLFPKYKQELDGIRKDLNFQKIFEKKFKPALKYNSVIGNAYNCSLFISLISILEMAKRNQKILIGGFGSGAGSIFLEAKVTMKGNFKSDLEEQIKRGKKISIFHYLKLRKKLSDSKNILKF